MTYLTKSVSRITPKKVNARNIIITLAPASSASTALIGLRLKGQRTQYIVDLSDLYRLAALWHGNKEHGARRQAKRDGIPWRQAKKTFAAANRI